MNPSPVNVFSDEPTSPPLDWTPQKARWLRLNSETGGNSAFFPLTVKAFYVFGVLLQLFRSVTILLRSGQLFSTTYLPAFILFSSGMDLLGRCLTGDPSARGSTRNLQAGYRWLADPRFQHFSFVPLHTSIVTTPNGPYSISQLISLRHFTAHGQAAATSEIPQLDFLILQEMPHKLSTGMESYWSQLQGEPEPCNALAAANIDPYRNRPVFDTLWAFSSRETGIQLPIGDLFGQLDWRYDVPRI